MFSLHTDKGRIYNLIAVFIYELNSIRFIRIKLSTQNIIFILYHTAFVTVINIFSSNHNLSRERGASVYTIHVLSFYR